MRGQYEVHNGVEGERTSYAWRRSVRYGIWGVAAAAFVIVGTVSPKVTPLLLAATFLSPLGLWMAVDLIGSPMPMSHQLRLTYRTLRDSLREALSNPGERLALACATLAGLFLTLQAIVQP